MAVSVQTPFHSKLGVWNMGDPPTTFSSTAPGAVPGNMTYQYPLPPGLDSPANMIPSFHALPLDQGPPHSPSSNMAHSSGIATQGISAGSKSSKIKRSMSTPNVRGQATADAAALALSAEKRRNKLGYHRTSVACGHCRRRKIRCIPAPADPQNRCSNCIRLKKECNFYPVDQQPPQDSRRRDSKAQNGTGRASESSSPSTSSVQLPDIPASAPFPRMSMPPIQDLGGPQMKRQRTESFSPENTGSRLSSVVSAAPSDNVPVVTSSRNFDYSTGGSWMGQEASPSTTKSANEAPQTFWRVNPQETPLTPAFSPYSAAPQIPPAQNWPTPNPEPSSRDDISWSVPQRSISYSNLEGLPSHQQYPSYGHTAGQQMGDHYATKPRMVPSGMYPPPISTSNSETPSTPHDIPQHPHSANSLPPAPYQTWHQQQYYGKPSTDAYGTWNGPHGGQQSMGPGQGQQPSQGYGYGQSMGEMYYPPHPER